MHLTANTLKVEIFEVGRKFSLFSLFIHRNQVSYNDSHLYLQIVKFRPIRPISKTTTFTYAYIPQHLWNALCDTDPICKFDHF